MRMSLYKLNLLVQNYPLLQEMIENVQLIGPNNGGLGRTTFVEVTLKQIPKTKEFVIKDGKIIDK